MARAVALVLALAGPAVVLGQGLPTLTLNADKGAFNGKWVYRYSSDDHR